MEEITMADVYTRIGLIKGPQGDTGATGPTGPQGNAATISVGTVSTTAYGNPAQVVNVGDEHDAIFNIVIPQGAPGATVTQMDNLALNTITAATDEYPQIQIGDTGRTIFGKIVKFFQDLVSKLALKVNYTDSLTLEEIAASSDLTNKVASAEAAETLRESLSTSLVFAQNAKCVEFLVSSNNWCSIRIYTDYTHQNGYSIDLADTGSFSLFKWVNGTAAKMWQK